MCGGHSKDALSRAAKIRPSVLILANSRSKMSIPSRRPFDHVIGNTCPFPTSVPLVGYVTVKSERNMRGGIKKRAEGTYNHALQGEEGREKGGGGGRKGIVGRA